MRLLLISVSALMLAACSETTPAAPAATEPAAAPAADTAAPAAAVEYGAAGTYAIDPTHTSVTWRVNHFGLSKYTGRFKTVDATLQFNPEDPAANSITVTIDPRSVETDYPADYKAAGTKTWAATPTGLTLMPSRRSPSSAPQPPRKPPTPAR